MKKLFTLALCVLFIIPAFSQYYLVSSVNAGKNPGNLNNDAEQPSSWLAANLTGYTEIMASTATASWTTAQTIPFTFSFNGIPVTQYFVSNTGVVTFFPAPGTPPPTLNTTLPSVDIPNMSVMAWGLEINGSNDAIVSKTFGTTPNRQHWIIWASASQVGLGSGGQWAYWGIVLEETTNTIHIVDMRNYSQAGGNVKLTAGMQIDAITAIMVPGSPNLKANNTATSGNGSDASDNSYYSFIYGTQPNFDLEMSSIAIGNNDGTAQLNNNNDITGSVINRGAKTITSFDLSYTVDGAGLYTHNFTGVSIAPNTTYNFTHGTPWKPTSGGGTVKTIDVWTTNLNGNPDENPVNDTLSDHCFLNMGVTGTKNVLLEEFTTVPCGYCPDGALVVEDILANHTNVIATGVHAGFGTDAMTIPAASAYASAFTTGAPTAVIDRKYFEGESNVAISRSIWEQKVVDQLNSLTPCNVLLSGAYKPATRDLTLKVDINFVDYAPNSDYRITVQVIEDSVTGTGSQYDQRNYYSSAGSAVGGPNHPFYPLPDPIVGYVHKHVLSDVINGIWGEAGIVSNTPQPNDKFTKNYTYNVNQAMDENQVYLIALVSMYDADVKKRNVLNAVQVKLTDLISVGFDDPVSSFNVNPVYPNPAADIAFLSFDLEQTQMVNIKVFDAFGKNTGFVKTGNYASGNHVIGINTSNFASGVYMITIEVGNQRYVQKFVVTK
jgi:Outer membrane protein Omp28/Secretion system C-terminal sorting domain